ncbi:MAG: DUF29 domain-containing protein [Bryobacteraceae bacterium]|nr:DUF29 domain-containing protein [Bryobacteraceae bacterium]
MLIREAAASMTGTSHERDLQAWAFEQARRLRAGESVDAEHIAAELETLGRAERNNLANRLAVLIQHLLKCEYQPGKHTRNWDATVREQRKRVNRPLHQNPSLRSQLDELIADAWDTAVTFASVETGIIEEDFPAACTYSVEFLLEGTDR